MSASEQSIPLCVECNGAITPTDLLHESVLALMRSRFWQIFCIPIWLLGGRAALKSKLADVTDLNWDVMPINQEVVDYVREARAEGRAAFLVTASDGRFARGFADRLKIFDEVIVSDEVSNSTGPWKSAVLHERFGLRGYDFVGSSARDLPVWRGARKAILVTNSDRLIRRAKSVANVDKVIRIPPPTRLDYLRMMRLHQWLKNILVFLPAVAAHQIGRSPVFLRALLAFFAFGLCASSVYLLNDMLDLETDRQHPRKRNRALASARIPIARAAAFIPVLLCASIAIALELPKTFVAIILGYFSITLSYSVILKRQVIVDVIMLAGLYTTRVVGGAAATNIQPSFWLLAFSMFIFLSLALVKRYSELQMSLSKNTLRTARRGYTPEDLPVLLALGVASGFASVLIVALYINNPDILQAYPSSYWLWFLPALLLYWVSRLWMKTHRGEMHDDPVVFAIRDWQSLVVGSLSAACLFIAATLKP